MSDSISREEAKKEVYLLGKNPSVNEIWDCLDELPSADAEPNCVSCKHYEPKYDVCHAPELVKQVTSKLKNPCDSLLTEESNGSKEHKSKLDHDREWIIGCIKHDGFIKTDRFDKANQIILDALSADAVQGEWIMHIDDLFPCESTQECSVCHAEQTISISDDNYCPNCGARMKGGDDE